MTKGVPMIIGISGYKQGGKTTLAEYLKKELRPIVGHGCGIRSFADALKELVLRYWIRPVCQDDFGVELWDKEDFKQTKHPCGNTYRELLQQIGTDEWRKRWPDMWVENYKRALREITNPKFVVLTPDVRFPNEVKCIQDMGGKVIRLLRRPFPEDNHESETALEKIQAYTWKCFREHREPIDPVFDIIIDNREISLQDKNEQGLKIVKGWLKC